MGVRFSNCVCLHQEILNERSNPIWGFWILSLYLWKFNTSRGIYNQTKLLITSIFEPDRIGSKSRILNYLNDLFQIVVSILALATGNSVNLISIKGSWWVWPVSRGCLLLHAPDPTFAFVGDPCCRPLDFVFAFGITHCYLHYLIFETNSNVYTNASHVSGLNPSDIGGNVTFRHLFFFHFCTSSPCQPIFKSNVDLSKKHTY
jgi:hypothetical protein